MRHENIARFAGHRLWCLARDEAAAIESAISRGEVDGVFVSRARGFSGGDLACLNAITNLRMLAIDEIEDVDISGVARLGDLEFLSIGNASGQLDIGSLTSLKHLRLRLAPGRALPEIGLPNLRHLALWNFSGVDLEFLGNYQTLEHIEISEARKLISLDGIGNSTDLISVKILYCPVLSTINSLALLGKLRILEIVNAKKISEYSAIANLHMLSSLIIEKSAPIASLKIIDGLKQLESVVLLNAFVEDGDLHPLTILPRLSHIYIENKKSYDPSPKEIEALIASRQRQP